MARRRFIISYQKKIENSTYPIKKFKTGARDKSHAYDEFFDWMKNEGIHVTEKINVFSVDMVNLDEYNNSDGYEIPIPEEVITSEPKYESYEGC